MVSDLTVSYRNLIEEEVLCVADAKAFAIKISVFIVSGDFGAGATRTIYLRDVPQATRGLPSGEGEEET